MNNRREHVGAQPFWLWGWRASCLPANGMRQARRLCYAIFCALVVSSAFGQQESEFAKANQEYAQGHFKEAIAGYEALVRGGRWNANLFYDLGNAYFRTHDFGRAILNYERAL